VARRWYFAVASAVIVLTMVVTLALALGAAKSPPVLSVCGGYLTPNGNCVGIPGPEDSGATCVPQPEGPCSWFWESPYPAH
jgi:hypothetical protein